MVLTSYLFLEKAFAIYRKFANFFRGIILYEVKNMGLKIRGTGTRGYSGEDN